MIKSLWITIFTALIIICNAQKKAVTETGDAVFLYPDGTWKYVKSENNIDTIKTNLTKFNKSADATFLLKSKNGINGFWLNPKKWTFGKSISNSQAEFEFSLKGESLQGIVLIEPTEIPLESFKSIAIENAKVSIPDIHIIHQEYRIVNGLKILFLQLEGTTSGMKIIYSCYYYSGSNTSIQFLTYTYQNVFNKYSKVAEDLLNGIVELEDTDVKEIKSNKSDSLPQGISSVDNNCKKQFVGNWQYDVIDSRDLKKKEVVVVRTIDKTLEYMDNKKYVYEYDNKWISNCKYELIFKRTTDPNFKLINIGEIISVEIDQIDNEQMSYTSEFRNNIKKGEMVKIKPIK